MPWFRNQPMDDATSGGTAHPDDGAQDATAPRPWWASPATDAGVPPVPPDFDAIVGGRTPTDSPAPAVAPAVPAAVVPAAVVPAAVVPVPVVPAAVVPAASFPTATPERRTVLGGLPRPLGTVSPPSTVSPPDAAAMPDTAAMPDAAGFAPVAPTILTDDDADADATTVEPIASVAVEPVVIDAAPVAVTEIADPLAAGGEGDQDELLEPLAPRSFAKHAGTHLVEEADEKHPDPAPDPAPADGAPTGELPAGDAPSDGASSTLSPLDLDVQFDPADAGDVDEEHPPAPASEDVPVPVAEIGLSFGERIERLIAAAVAEADNTRADAQHEAEQVLQSAQLDAEHTVAAAQRQSAELVASAQRRCDADLAAAQHAREEAERALSEARAEADELRRHARDEVAELRTEVDLHAQAMLARTHADTTRTLAAARAELDEIAMRKAELEGQMSAIRALLSDTVVEPLPPAVDAAEPVTGADATEHTAAIGAAGTSEGQDAPTGA